MLRVAQPSLILMIMTLASHAILAQELHQRIDQWIPLPASPLVATPVEDGLFLRRLSLDLRNTVPTTAELQEFAADTDPNKRIKWVDRFFADPLFSEKMVTWLDLTLMERRPAQNVDRQAWLTWLRTQIDEGTPIDALTRKIVGSEWWNRDTRPAQRFFLDRDGDPHLITRDFSRIFLGRDIQCAQCHDHPLIADYRQRDYQGLVAFFASSSLVEITYKDAENKDQKMKLFVEKAASDTPYESVFAKGKPHWSGPALLDRLPTWEAYQVPSQRYQEPAVSWMVGESPRKPTRSRRSELAPLVTDPQLRPFAENWSNRLWALAFGEGIVHPLDMHHPDNPPDNPQLLQGITDGLIELRFDAKAFLRQIVLSQAYQRSNRLPVESAADSLLTIDLPKLQAELEGMTAQEAKLQEAAKLAEDVWSQAIDAMNEIEAEHVRLRNELSKSDAALVDATKKRTESTTARDKALADLNQAKQKQSLLAEGVAKLEEAKKLDAKEDPELMAAIQTSIQKRDAAAASIAPLEQAHQTAETNLAKTVEVEQAATKQATDLAGSLDAIRPTIEQKYQAIVQARDAWRLAERAKKLDGTRQNYLKEVIQLASSRSQRATIAQTLPALQANVAQLQTQIDSAVKQMSDLDQQMQTQQSQRNEINKQFVSVQERFLGKQNEKTQLVSAKQQLEATQNLIAEKQSIANTLTEIDKALAQRDSEMVTISAEVESIKNSLQSVDTMLTSIGTQKQSMVGQRDALVNSKAQEETKIAEGQTTLQQLDSQWPDKSLALVEQSADQLSTARLRALSPEQLCWSILRVMGVFDQYVANERAELDKTQPLPADPPATDAIKADREKLAVRRAIDKLRGNADHFAKLFAAGSGQADVYFASADQALYFANGGAIHSWAGPSGSNLTARIQQSTDIKASVEDLYGTLLCRKPSELEIQLLEAHWNVPADQRPARIHESVWAMLSSAEFRFIQ